MAFPSAGLGPISRGESTGGIPRRRAWLLDKADATTRERKGQFPDYPKLGGRNWGSCRLAHAELHSHFSSDYSLPLGVFVNRFQTNQFEFFYASRRLHLHFVAFPPTQQGPADRRSRGDQSLRRVGFFAGHQLVFNFGGFVHVAQPDARPVSGAIARNIAEIQHAEIAHTLLELAQTSRNEALALFGVFVFRILRKIPVSPRLHQFLGQLEI